jgi:hypothetical protein
MRAGVVFAAPCATTRPRRRNSSPMIYLLPTDCNQFHLIPPSQLHTPNGVQVLQSVGCVFNHWGSWRGVLHECVFWPCLALQIRSYKSRPCCCSLGTYDSAAGIFRRENSGAWAMR